nr:DEAD/DEAH box helicase [uncultured Comamonas sp.]
MAINLGALRKTSLVDTEVNPREIFNLLPGKDKKYIYPRDVQAVVWDRWMPRREDKDVVIKMNTGGGKTVVGLLILKSCLNEGVGPAIYITPDKYLASQVIREANDLGIEVTTDQDSHQFLQGKSILVTNIYHLINEKSVFGTSDTGRKIAANAILVDDAHACLSITESQFSLSIPRDHDLFDSFLNVFEDDLKLQNHVKFLEIEQSDPEAEMLLPFWAWSNKLSAITKILVENKNDDQIKFTWPLIKNYLAECRCIFSGRGIEISPKCLPMDAIPTFTQAQRRLFMTATLADDSILVSDYGVSENLAKRHITPTIANDIGDRMILIPQEIDPEITEDEIKEYLKKKSKNYNTVVIVPSDYRAKYWQDAADLIVKADNISEAVSSLKSRHVGLVVFINKYDGVDLPGSACRILILDGLPQARRLQEKIDMNILAGGEQMLGKQIQRIEQGMGRGIRANDDYCVVLLIGASLTRSIFLMEAKNKFSPATAAQLNMSAKVADQLDGGISGLDEAVELCLNQTQEWKSLSRESLANISYPPEGKIRPIAVAQRKAFDSATIGDYTKAQSEFQNVINSEANNVDLYTLGWLKWQLAELKQHTNPAESQQILKSALAHNRRITRPLDGITYEKIGIQANFEQSRNSVWKIKPFDGKSNSLTLQINGLLDDLSFAPNNSERFEEAIKEIGSYLGFFTQRPEQEFNDGGPDDLWYVDSSKFFVIECKSSATAEKISKSYTNQLSGHINWFHTRYGEQHQATPILIYPTNKFEHDASPHPKTRIITKEKLAEFKEAVRGFIKSCIHSMSSLDANKINQYLTHHRLTANKILDSFTETPK